jgi:tRNA G46 methylase TrmB
VNDALPRAVRSAQSAVHPRLHEIVRRHLASASRAPVPAHTRAAFEVLVRDPRMRDRPLVLDSGCGTGESSTWLAQRFPDALVIGIDQSQARLRRAPRELPDRVVLLRAECAAFWRLLREHGSTLHAHALLHPNPWPKPAQLMRRWHAHPAFADVLALGGRIELRSNWQVYAQEFAAALELAGRAACSRELPTDAPVVSAFDRKYRGVGLAVWQVASE